MSRAQIDKLGKRIAKDQEQPGDELLLQQVMTAYGPALELVVQRLQSAGFEPSSRPKTMDTLKEKLRRNPQGALSRIQDTVGCRLRLGPATLTEQTAIGQAIADLFPGPPSPTWSDRRADPSFGYRALHVIVYQDGLPVEIQIRTRLQHAWAEASERLGDRWGRAVRYGGEPSDPERSAFGSTGTRREACQWMLLVSQAARGVEELRDAAASRQIPPYHGDRAALIEALEKVVTSHENLTVALRDMDSALTRLLHEVLGRLEGEEGA